MTPSDKFAKAAGIHLEPEVKLRKPRSCDMCALLRMDVERSKLETSHRENLIVFLMRAMDHRDRRCNHWRLLAFAGLVWGVLMMAVAMRGRG